MNELILIEKKNALDIFTKRELITPLLEKIEYAALQESQDVTTDKGRKAIASMAYRVAQSKTYIEGHGKELAAELKELPRLVDSNRKYAKDFLDALRVRIRKPLDEWEAEQELIKLKAKIEIDHEEALLLNIEWELKQKQEKERIEKERAEYEAKVLIEAEARAKIAAEEKSRREIIEAEARAIAAENEIKRQAEQAKRDIEIAEQRAKAEAQRAFENEQRILKEKEEADRQSKLNQENIDRVHKSIFDDLAAIGLNDAQCQYILDALCEGKIKAVKIEY